MPSPTFSPVENPLCSPPSPVSFRRPAEKRVAPMSSGSLSSLPFQSTVFETSGFAARRAMSTLFLTASTGPEMDRSGTIPPRPACGDDKTLAERSPPYPFLFLAGTGQSAARASTLCTSAAASVLALDASAVAASFAPRRASPSSAASINFSSAARALVFAAHSSTARMFAATTAAFRATLSPSRRVERRATLARRIRSASSLRSALLSASHDLASAAILAALSFSNCATEKILASIISGERPPLLPCS
mmetsp:Transcript_1078/g.2349  ORF Transcript_1078/g.2349 Transcript_1078/m.2349 type:complete len:249 (+) Transcript_1078:787-1533(+)